MAKGLETTINVLGLEQLQDWAEKVIVDLEALAAENARLRGLETSRTDATTREALAAYAHNAWAGWMVYLLNLCTSSAGGTVTIPAWAVDRWQRQIVTAYADLPEAEKQSDRAEADKMLALVQDCPQCGTPLSCPCGLGIGP